MYPVKNIRITSNYGEREFDGWHSGVDFGSMPKGIPNNEILSIDNGIVKVSKNNPGGYGEYIVIEYEGYCMLVAHLSHRSVNVGDTVKSGDMIGFMGNTPLERGLAVHLHAEIRNVSFNHPEFWDKKVIRGKKTPIHCVDPIPYFEAKKDYGCSGWAVEAWDWAVKNKITDGTRPKEAITREEVAQMFYNYNKKG